MLHTEWHNTEMSYCLLTSLHFTVQSQNDYFYQKSWLKLQTMTSLQQTVQKKTVGMPN